jgi:hypothetical protein
MKVFYAASTHGFYNDVLHSVDQVPADGVPITEDRHQELMLGQSQGFEIVADEQGFPVLKQPSLDDNKVHKRLEISNACSVQIVSGFVSEALGKPHEYPSTVIDQNNLNANVVSSIYPNLPAEWVTPQMCSDITGAWAYRMHTAKEIQQVGMDGKAWVLLALSKKDKLSQQIETATTTEELGAITW